MTTTSYGIEYTKVAELKGPLMIIDGVTKVSFDELVEIETVDGEHRLGRVLEVGFGKAIVQVFEGTTGLTITGTKAKFIGKTMEMPVSQELLGRVFDGLGKPNDGLPDPIADRFLDVNGEPMNPERREYPTSFIQTGVSVIDGMLTLVRGQKLPIFSGSGLPHNVLAAQIARQATVEGAKEYLAYDLGMHVLAILTDMTNYCEALREISAAREEVPGRKGYPGYLYTDLANNYERAGRIRGKNGSVTQVPILSMPADDITHPIPDLTGYITEGQVVLGRDLFRKGVYPPVNVLMSLSRLMKDGVGEGKTRSDHMEVGNQLYDAYSRAQEVRALAEIVGRSGLTGVDLKYMDAGDMFESHFLKQGQDENRGLEETLSRSWDILSTLPEGELTKIKEKHVRQYYKESK